MDICFKKNIPHAKSTFTTCTSAEKEENERTMAAETRGSIAFFSCYRPPVPLDIYSCQVELPLKLKQKELRMTDGRSYNYNGQIIPSAALKTLLKRPELASQGTDADVDSGRLSGMIFVSERGNLETLHIGLRFRYNPPKVFSLADVFGTSTFSGVRLEDSGCFAGDYLIYVSTKDPAPDRRQPWTAVYKTKLMTGETDRLTPPGEADLSPSVSPSGKQILVASFQGKGGWDGEIENLKTDIFRMDVDRPFKRKLVVRNGGWPTWGSDDIIFFHRKVYSKKPVWAVFRADINSGVVTRVTPDGIHAITPAAINATTVAVATINMESGFGDIRTDAQYRHIEIFNSSGEQESIKITQKTRPKADHFKPFVIDGGKRIGYHRCKNDLIMDKKLQKLDSPHPDIGVFRVTGVFPTFSKDGSKLAFVDTEFNAVWVAEKKGLRLAYREKGPHRLFSPVWNQDPKKDTLYVCVGPAFHKLQEVAIHAITQVSRFRQQSYFFSDDDFRRQSKKLTQNYNEDFPPPTDSDGNIMHFNNAFPSSSPDGARLVFRSRREDGFKNLYIMEDAEAGELEGSAVTRLTNGNWVDTQCQWSPSGDWIVFSSNRDKPLDAPALDNDLDLGYFAVYLVKANDPRVVVRVMGSASDLAGHVNHPIFSPDGRSIVVTSDLAAVSVEPISLPLSEHSGRPYGDIFTIDDIDWDDISNNKDTTKFTRITHSRYENSTATWTMFSTPDPNVAWNMLRYIDDPLTPTCPYVYPGGGESWHMTGHICIPRSAC